jgi:hypothetical protein
MRSQVIDPVSPLNEPVSTPSLRRQGYSEETLVIDERALCSPAQAVEEKLSQMLESSCIGVSHLRLKSILCSRTKSA